MSCGEGGWVRPPHLLLPHLPGGADPRSAATLCLSFNLCGPPFCPVVDLTHLVSTSGFPNLATSRADQENSNEVTRLLRLPCSQGPFIRTRRVGPPRPMKSLQVYQVYQAPGFGLRRRWRPVPTINSLPSPSAKFLLILQTPPESLLFQEAFFTCQPNSLPAAGASAGSWDKAVTQAQRGGQIDKRVGGARRSHSGSPAPKTL